MVSIRRWPGLRSSVRLRATLAATLVVALALGLSAFVLVSALRGSLHDGAGLEATRRAEAAIPMASTGLPGHTPAPATPAPHRTPAPATPAANQGRDSETLIHTSAAATPGPDHVAVADLSGYPDS